MIIKVEVQLKMHAIFHPPISFFHPFKNKVHQNSQAIDLTWHNVMAKWIFDYSSTRLYFTFENILMVNAC
jgi:hypothetical protein